MRASGTTRNRNRNAKPDPKEFEHVRLPDRDRRCIICHTRVNRHAPDRVDIWIGGVIVAGMHAGCF